MTRSHQGMSAVIALVALSSPLPPRAPRCEAPPAIPAHGYFSLSVPDMEASRRWYSEKLGLCTSFDFPPTPTLHAGATFVQGGSLYIELVQVEGAVTLQQLLPAHAGEEIQGRQYVYGPMKVGAVVDSFDATVATLRARGVEIVALQGTKHDQPATVTIRDNAGNRILLMDASWRPSSSP
jgi:methylmalonyl-CoA/ethylmalonyl-CoA epimerase